MAYKLTDEEQRRYNALLKIGASHEEALDAIATDREIDRGADPFPLSAEQKKVAKKMTNAETHAKVERKKVERKANTTKADLVTFLAEMLQNKVENVEITNAERQIAFSCGDEMFELTLVQKRKPKK